MPTNLNPDPWLPAAPAPPGWDACALSVFRVTVNTLGLPTGLVPLPNLECLSVQEQEGPDPGAALFRYRFDGLDSEAPQSAEQALSTAFTGTRVVETSWRLAVRVTRPDGAEEWLWDGYPVTWSVSLDGGHESVLITGTGLAKSCWDKPVGGALVRDSSTPETVADVPTGLVARFNPDGRGNASPSTADRSDSADAVYPTFLDPDITTTADGDGNDYPRTFTLPMAAAHLIYVNNAAGVVSNPTRSELDALLIGREPLDDSTFDPSDGSTFTAKPIAAADTPITGRPWPTALHDQIKDYGFGMRFEVAPGGTYPTTALKLWLKQAGPVKSLYLASRLSPLVAGSNNLAEAQLGRDLAGVVNRWVVDGALDRWEVSFVLACGFPSSAGDATNPAPFDKSDPAFATSASYDAYRLFVLDEGGDGHYAPASTTKLTTPTSLDDVLGAPDTSTTPPTPRYVTRRRKPIGALFEPDGTGRPLRARLAISKDYTAAKPGVWDGTGSWQHVSGGFELLPDRVGIRINVQNPNHWDVGKSLESSAPFPQGVVKAVQCVAAPDAQNPAFSLRLTCVIEADRRLEAVADALASSPVGRPVEGRVDASDRYSVRKRYYPSEFNDGSGGSDETVRDDTDLAKAEAVALRTATDSGVFEGTVTIPYLTRYYKIGDRIDRIAGRELGLRTDAGGSGWSPVLPVVVGRRWDLDGGQTTTLTLSDAGLDRRRTKARGSRGGSYRQPVGDRQAKAREVARLAAQIQAAGFGVATGRL